MPGADHLSGLTDWIDLEFVEREATPEPLMKLSIQLHAAGLSLADTVSVLDEFGVDRARSTVHNWGETHGNRNAVERVFKEVKRRTNQFASHFRHASHQSAENWLQTFAFVWNQLI